jgi:hypothetical protein
MQAALRREQLYVLSGRANSNTSLKQHRGNLGHNVLGLQAYIPNVKVSGLPFPLLACDVSSVQDHSFTHMNEASGDYKLRSKLQVGVCIHKCPLDP